MGRHVQTGQKPQFYLWYVTRLMKEKPYIIKNLLQNQKGYLGLFLFFAILLVVMILMPAQYSQLPPQSDAGQCVINPPNSADSFTDGNDTFDLIKKNAPIIGVQVELHLHLGKDLMVNGKMRRVTQTIAESDISNWAVADEVERAKWHNVRFVHITDAPKGPPGTRFIDIYIKRGTQIPNDILNFCKANKTDWKSFFADDEDQSFPPKELDAADITEWTCDPSSIPGSQPACIKIMNAGAPHDKIYYLYAYDANGMEPIAYVKRTNQMPHATIRINGQEYKIVYYGGWESKHLRLETIDPLTGQEIGYRYANPERLRIPEDPYKFLNKTETATDSLQLQVFTPFQIPNSGWWTPECKPAIYLYPKSAMNINVKVKPKGSFIYTDPIYNQQTGWNIKAYPSGKLEWLDGLTGIDSKKNTRPTNMYEYLYYESKIHDSAIQKPTEGYVVPFDQLTALYTSLLPKLGLEENELNDFVEYWQKSLPYSPYYFVGIIDPLNVEQIEPLEITPKPDHINRVRLYFERLETPKEVTAPNLEQFESWKLNLGTPNLKVVEWGGMVKQDKNHPFTCSM